jgi:hypothetical protein
MMAKSGKEHAAKVALAVAAIVGLLVPVIIGVAVSVTPDTTLRAGDVGTFETSNTSTGGFLAPFATTLQTSTGSIVVLSPLSVARGQHLRIEDRLKSGLQLCVQTKPPTCAAVAGEWTGQLQPVGQQSHAITRFAAHVGIPGAAAWFSLGLFATLIAVFSLARRSSHDASSDGTEPGET